jgi:hypothetical protein
VLDAIVYRESEFKTKWSCWGHQVGNDDGWGVSEEKEVLVEVRSRLEESEGSSACRCRFDHS